MRKIFIIGFIGLMGILGLRAQEMTVQAKCWDTAMTDHSTSMRCLMHSVHGFKAISMR